MLDIQWIFSYQCIVIYSSVTRVTWTWLHVTFFYQFRNSSTFLSTICCLLYNLSSTVLITNTTRGVAIALWPWTPFTIDLKVYWDIEIRSRTKISIIKFFIILEEQSPLLKIAYLGKVSIYIFQPFLRSQCSFFLRTQLSG